MTFQLPRRAQEPSSSESAANRSHKTGRSSSAFLSFFRRKANVRKTNMAGAVDAAAARTWSALPCEIMQRIMQHVPLRQRLGFGSCCSLVCRSWAEAAAAATDSIVLDHCTAADSLQLWLHNHGSKLTKLHLHAANGELTELPCPRLKDLLLTEESCLSKTQLGSAQSLSTTDLQHLHFLDLKTPKVTSMLAGLQSLEQLSLSGTLPPLNACILQLSRLTRLELARRNERGKQPSGGTLEVPQRPSRLQQLSRLPKLSHLVVDWFDLTEVDCAGMEGLSGLTFLQLSHVSCRIDAASAHGLSQLTALQHLGISGPRWPSGGRGRYCCVQASLLAGLTKLRSLDLHRVEFQRVPLPAAELDTAGGTAAELADHDSSDAAAKKMHVLLPPLPDLTCLCLINCLSYSPPPSADSSATVAFFPTTLQQLSIAGLRMLTWPEGHALRWCHMFNPRRPLLTLQWLDISNISEPRLLLENLEGMVVCCPALQELRAEGTLPPGMDLSVLNLLPGLTCLSTRATTSEDACSLAALTDLRSLSVDTHGELSLVELQPLSALQSLTSLTLRGVRGAGAVTGGVTPESDSLREEQKHYTEDGCCFCFTNMVSR